MHSLLVGINVSYVGLIHVPVLIHYTRDVIDSNHFPCVIVMPWPLTGRVSVIRIVFHTSLISYQL
uniref:Uncharacterized protein n=1 Tax=Anguilla anguilla TaxID=7936 RepID=A0A0E9XA44_ANGAN